ncbi:hypothetical protein Ae356Ps1_0208c [Pseudonocardia sp. Ae356_Ps1]|nr:hypothetical protein Ae356Ps1_0208c [Pseudonocardia sp. Ae356_Ps1]
MTHRRPRGPQSDQSGVGSRAGGEDRLLRRGEAGQPRDVPDPSRRRLPHAATCRARRRRRPGRSGTGRLHPGGRRHLRRTHRAPTRDDREGRRRLHRLHPGTAIVPGPVARRRNRPRRAAGVIGPVRFRPRHRRLPAADRRARRAARSLLPLQTAPVVG